MCAGVTECLLYELTHPGTFLGHPSHLTCVAVLGQIYEISSSNSAAVPCSISSLVIIPEHAFKFIALFLFKIIIVTFDGLCTESVTANGLTVSRETELLQSFPGIG